MTYDESPAGLFVPQRREPSPYSVRPTPDLWAALRAPFPPEQIGKLPRVYCYDCGQANKNRRGATCDQHQKRPCAVCRNNISTAHLHLDYIGHAAVVSRILSVDPYWSWDPIPQPEKSGYPQPTASGMWIELTILGVTRPGYGDTGNTQLGTDDAIKARISDAIKNAAQRFGVGIDIWSKEDLIGKEEADAEHREQVQRNLRDGDEQPAAPSSGRDWAKEAQECTDMDALTALASAATDAGEFTGKAKAALVGRRRQLESKAARETPAEKKEEEGK